MAEATTRGEQIVAAALELLESHGPDGVTMRAIADRLGIRAPSLYKHVTNKQELEVAMIAEGFRQVAGIMAAAAREDRDPLASLAAAYRGWALDHPHLYRLMTYRPLPRDELPAGVEDTAAAPVMRVARGDPDAARALWAFAHGMTALEIAGRFPPDADLDTAWAAGLGALRSLAADDSAVAAEG